MISKHETGPDRTDGSTPRELWLGMADGYPAHWGRPSRRAIVRDRPLLATGRRAWRVRVDPPLPLPFTSGTVAEVVVAERYADERLDDPDVGWATVNIAGYTRADASSKDRFDDGDLELLYVAEAARQPDRLPDEWDVQRFWERTLARIERFVERHGHSWVPDGYRDEDGRLDILVGNIRFHHAGRAGTSEGPFPGVDHVPALDRLPGWEWDEPPHVEDPSC